MLLGSGLVFSLPTSLSLLTLYYWPYTFAGNTPGGNDDEDIDFDDLTARFEALKKRK